MRVGQTVDHTILGQGDITRLNVLRIPKQEHGIGVEDRNPVRNGFRRDLIDRHLAVDQIGLGGKGLGMARHRVGDTSQTR